jgi:hypothetical protein
MNNFYFQGDFFSTLCKTASSDAPQIPQCRRMLKIEPRTVTTSALTVSRCNQNNTWIDSYVEDCAATCPPALGWRLQQPLLVSPDLEGSKIMPLTKKQYRIQNIESCQLSANLFYSGVKEISI